MVITQETIAGTKWKADDLVAYWILGGENYQYYEFQNGNQCRYFKTYNDSVSFDESGSYTFKSPKIFINRPTKKDTFILIADSIVSTSSVLANSDESLYFLKVE